MYLHFTSGSVCLYCPVEVLLDLSYHCTERNKHVLTAAHSFAIYLITDTMSHSDSSSEHIAQPQHIARQREITNKSLPTYKWIDKKIVATSMTAAIYGLYYDVTYSDSVEPLECSQPQGFSCDNSSLVIRELQAMFDFIIMSTLMSQMEANYYQAN